MKHFPAVARLAACSIALCCLAACDSASSGSPSPPVPPQAVEGIATPSSVAVVTATNTD
jgi:hypothetical protein